MRRKRNLEDFKINDGTIKVRYRVNKHKHITPALQTKENDGIERSNHTPSNAYNRLDSDKVTYVTGAHVLRKAKKKKKTKKRFY